jgi:hypothetical protein
LPENAGGMNLIARLRSYRLANNLLSPANRESTLRVRLQLMVAGQNAIVGGYCFYFSVMVNRSFFRIPEQPLAPLHGPKPLAFLPVAISLASLRAA